MDKGAMVRRQYTTTNILEINQYKNILELMQMSGIKVNMGTSIFNNPTMIVDAHKSLVEIRASRASKIVSVG